MGRRKIEIKAIKDDRNRSVTFLKRKGGLFKKAHELSVLCSVDVAVIIFGNNKKLYEYSSSNIRDILQRYTYHGGPNEHKGPSDFNGGVDDDDDDDENGTNSQGEQHIMYQPNPPVSYPFLRHTSISDSPPVPNGAFGPQPGHQMSRAHTPQPPFVARPPSVNDIRRLRPGQPVGPAGVAQELQNRSAFVPSPPIYNPQPPATMAPTHGLPTQLHPQYPFQPSQPPAHPMQQFEDQRRSPLPPTFHIAILRLRLNFSNHRSRSNKYIAILPLLKFTKPSFHSSRSGYRAQICRLLRHSQLNRLSSSTTTTTSNNLSQCLIKTSNLLHRQSQSPWRDHAG
ncbi:resistance to lethality of mkk1p386 overexpression [Neurospora sp. IMI 360204]|nr:resistance to lethality of mkk1p386 overexpression [Neurospora sp. IMI 360204]